MGTNMLGMHHQLNIKILLELDHIPNSEYVINSKVK